jgi:hypothetical protein
MKSVLFSFVAGACLVATAPVVAHHSFASEFDISRPVTLEGPVTKLEWTNPHAFVFVDVKDDQGKVQNWAVELVGINDLLRLGWGRNKVKIGDVLSIEGYGARNGTNKANATSATLTGTGELLWKSATRPK